MSLLKVDPDEYVGQVLSDRYFVERRIGRGAFASVYIAHHADGPPVAVKMLHTGDAMAQLRFIREIKVMQAIPRSPHLIGYVGQGGLPAGGAYLVMEYEGGPTLREQMSQGLLSAGNACVVTYQIALALEPLHRYGIVHRDLKPTNVLMTQDGKAKLFDFGLVLDAEGFLRLFEEEDILLGRAFSEDVEGGIIVGTPEYMAIEQFQDASRKEVVERLTSAASDVFSLGVILYRLVTGQFPFPMGIPVEQRGRRDYLNYFRKRTTWKLEDVAQPAMIDDALWSILCRALSDPAVWRYPDAKALADDLQSYLTTGQGVPSLSAPSTDLVPVIAVKKMVADVDGEIADEAASEELSIVTVWPDLGDHDWLAEATAGAPDELAANVQTSKVLYRPPNIAGHDQDIVTAEMDLPDFDEDSTTQEIDLEDSIVIDEATLVDIEKPDLDVDPTKI